MAAVTRKKAKEFTIALRKAIPAIGNEHVEAQKMYCKLMRVYAEHHISEADVSTFLLNVGVTPRT